MWIYPLNPKKWTDLNAQKSKKKFLRWEKNVNFLLFKVLPILWICYIIMIVKNKTFLTENRKENPVVENKHKLVTFVVVLRKLLLKFYFLNNTAKIYPVQANMIWLQLKLCLLALHANESSNIERNVIIIGQQWDNICCVFWPTFGCCAVPTMRQRHLSQRKY